MSIAFPAHHVPQDAPARFLFWVGLSVDPLADHALIEAAHTLKPQPIIDELAELLGVCMANS